MVLDMVLRFWCRNGDGGRCGGAEVVVAKSQVLHLATRQGTCHSVTLGFTDIFAVSKRD